MRPHNQEDRQGGSGSSLSYQLGRGNFTNKPVTSIIGTLEN